jgi:hypothetical protein
MHDNVINAGSLTLAIIAQVFNFVLLIIFLLYFGNFKKKGGIGSEFIHFGPSNKYIKINIFGFKINTWKKWLILIIFLMIIEVLNTFAWKIYKSWYRNLVSDPKAENILIGKTKSLIYITIWEFTTWFSEVFQWILLIITKQLQFVIPQFIARLVVSNIIDYHYLKMKTI